ncbi:MAG: DUF2868 domain-containing protein, partial [Neisseria sp.]|nr:DUF2868 domain-containing protein [Neisseria sp.]
MPSETIPNQEYRLIESVRLLEERGYLFAADPRALTDALRRAEGSTEEKLLQRAEQADRNHKLRDALNRVAQSSRLLLLGLTVLWAVLGFTATAALLGSSGLNFFLLLAAVLGTNSLMFLLWLASLPLSKNDALSWLNPAWRIRSKDALNSAVAQVYSNEWRSPARKWRLGMLTHRLWLASLSGMLAAAVLLLSLRQYTFNWESTLLSDGIFVQAVHWLGALPSALGFPVPDSEAVLGSRLNHNTASAREWGGLLVGSMLVYGILPRAAAWLFCRLKSAQYRAKLPLELPYYQEIIRIWQTEIIDADTVKEKVAAAVKPFVAKPDAPQYALMLERAWPDTRWFVSVLAQNWQDGGTADSRDSVAEWAARLQQEGAQLLIGIRAQTLPDRGLLRQIVRLAEAADGAAVQLLAEDGFSDGLAHYLEQWQQALDGIGISYLNPPV